MPGTSGVVVTVAAQEGDQVRLNLLVPMVGFPPGWELQPGDKVMLVQGEDGRPAVHLLVGVVDVGAETAEKGGILRAAGQEFAVQDATVREVSRDGRYLVFKIPNESGQNEQVVSIRRPQ